MPVSPQLEQWIRDALGKGLPLSEVEKKLLASGHSSDAVKRAFSEMGLKKSRRSPLAVVILALLIIGGVAFWRLGLPAPGQVPVQSGPGPIETTPEVLHVSLEQGIAQGEGCDILDEWYFNQNCNISSHAPLSPELSGKPLRVSIEASGSAYPLPKDWRIVNTYAFIGMTAQEALDRDWGDSLELVINKTHYDSSTGRRYSYIRDTWEDPLTPTSLMQSIKEQFTYLGEYDPNFVEFILDNYTIRGNVLEWSHHKAPRYDTALPVFRVSAGGEAQEIWLDSEDWKEYTLELPPQGASLDVKVEYLNDLWLPATREDGTYDLDRAAYDRNLYIRSVTVQAS